MGISCLGRCVHIHAWFDRLSTSFHNMQWLLFFYSNIKKIDKRPLVSFQMDAPSPPRIAYLLTLSFSGFFLSLFLFNSVFCLKLNLKSCCDPFYSHESINKENDCINKEKVTHETNGIMLKRERKDGKKVELSKIQ